ncbi:putative nucleotidyltransferase [Natronocella acetinitrilica]|uniref:Nucleotidyltransferase n=1 Tax=Natronocella acetinitrilica TaxID=414046 RepID=A0AAE3G1L3_9GAMM|nr:nucleotidyltransferase domain-containing protein [Natronocella acetinitrilica]MCP1673996.1 putative nucleotidyltransferase [Natronocella acetinitrilica]
MSTEAIIQQLRACFSEVQPSVLAAYLYGSHARGEARPGSDVDVALLLKPEHAAATLVGPIRRIQGELERRLRCEVDVLDLRSAPVDLVHRVLRDGVLLVENDANARIAFEVDARNRYFDLLPYLQEYRRRPVA